MHALKAVGIGSILDLSVEADIESGEISMEKAMAETRRIKELMISSIDIAAHEKRSFIAVKVTAMVPPAVLLRWSNSIKAGNIIGIDVASRNAVPKSKGPDPDHECIRPEDFILLDAVLPEMYELCQKAADKKVRIMVDAEQTYFQPAIDALALHLCEKYNKTTPVIYNTYQLYLKDALSRLQNDATNAAMLNYTLGVKIVRGAYMASERSRAKFLNLPDPIHNTMQDTHRSYNAAIEFLAAQVATESPKVSFIVASHNKDSVELAANALQSLNSPARTDISIGFAQLMGMQDGIAMQLVSRGFETFKYIPYGPVSVTIPYLLRRAQENSSLMRGSGAALDRMQLWQELKGRFTNQFNQ